MNAAALETLWSCVTFLSCFRVFIQIWVLVDGEGLFVGTTHTLFGFTHSAWTHSLTGCVCACMRARVCLPPSCLPAADSVPPSFSLPPPPSFIRLFTGKTSTHSLSLWQGINAEPRQEQDWPLPVRTIHGPPLGVRLTGGYVEYSHFPRPVRLKPGWWTICWMSTSLSYVFTRNSPMIAALCYVFPPYAAVKHSYWNWSWFKRILFYNMHRRLPSSTGDEYLSGDEADAS